MAHLCLVYFCSALGKINTSEWYKGVALYYTLVSERFGGTPINVAMAKNAYLVALGTYFTLVFQLAFPFLIWTKRMRVPLVIAGTAMHLSIYALMMIHDFAILFVFVYGLFFTNAEIMDLYSRIKGLFSIKSPVLFLSNKTENRQSINSLPHNQPES